MKFYIWFEKFMDLILRLLWILVVWIHEMKNIRKKKKLYSEIQLQPHQIQEIDRMWKQAYGRKIPRTWNRLYQSYMGQFDAKYFPEILFTTKLELVMNQRHVCRVLCDKNLLGILFEDDEVKVPKTIVSNAWGYLYDGSHNIITEEKMLEVLKDVGNIVIKPTINTNSGIGITMHNIQNGIDLLSGESVKNIIIKLNNNYIIQEKLVAHSDYARLYDKSINTIRIITYIVDNSVHHGPLALRIGRGGKFIDNLHAGGIMIGLTDHGILNKVGFSEMQDRFYKHPDSGVVFEGYSVSSTLQIINAAKRLHGRIPGIGIISWDFMIDKDDNVVIIECNLSSQSIWFPQMVNGCSFFGDDTEKMINLISKKK
ncbi:MULTISPECIES: sugar-transfer associated ATP-grasp domain-containing protein [unclassified Dehalobacter]|uniref:sugar-transfer associated ATP-grasp domain-containing protein n=1 Tax=unclassified Dehalobacter TaxID=2635733 RepID=UPI0003607B76|nr:MULTISPECIES: sugar-transfer associated ATP-grasp domain-containing protein [unclassified Dehalobacter]RJE48978.1 hypothetical protein A7K50_07635 [Dehalobacter sp. MCB1]TCX51716.1 hypothetical protein C1I36_05135 [Dehalobacter sp. 14DCB1]TCX52776.1 hypothetical protein C1I38_06815 [Dehalobacter sp. 12DCB1]